jgi:hypothetical protein
MNAGTVAAISSGAVALATIGAGLVTHRGTLRHSRTLTDLESVRGVLDDAAVALHELEFAFDEVLNGLTSLGVTFFEDEQAIEVYDNLALSCKEAHRHRERLGIRLGRVHEAVVAFGAASEAAGAPYSILWRLRREGGPAANERSRRFFEKSFADGREQIDGQREIFDAKREQFIDAAQKLAGAKLSTQD